MSPIKMLPRGLDPEPVNSITSFCPGPTADEMISHFMGVRIKTGRHISD